MRMLSVGPEEGAAAKEEYVYRFERKNPGNR
jgi:hypothetical protein